MEQQERGYYYVADRYVCSDCFDDYAIAAFIKKNAQRDSCDYCGKSTPGSAIAAPIDDVIGLIVEGIESEWGDPDNEGMAYESAEGCYQGTVTDTWDLLLHELEVVDDSGSALFKDLMESLGHRTWCQKDFYALPPHEALIFGWQHFSEQVKGVTRYTFFRAADPCEKYRGSEEIPLAKMLDRLAKVISETDLVKEFPIGSRFIRVRPTQIGEVFTSAADLGTCPQDRAKQSNRMSPAGIPMFYGASDEDTAVLETCNGEPIATIGVFETLKPFKTIDLTNLPGIPSLFDSRRRWLRPGLKFLYAFVRDVSKAIERDGREHIEYVPTQIVSEFFRHLFRDDEDDVVKGILYPSAKRPGGTACVLFFENGECCDLAALATPNGGDDKWLALMEYRARPLGTSAAF